MPDSSERSLLALDFDGVICNSLREVLAVSLMAYEKLIPATTLRERLGDRAGQTLDSNLFDRFSELVPLGNRAEDFAVALSALDHDVEIADQDSYDAYMASLDSDFLSTYHSEFYAQRNRLRGRDTNAWLALHTPYESFNQLLRQHPATLELAIATAKDRASVQALLNHFGLSELFPTARILDKDTATSKSIHLQVLAEASGIPLPRITFVDDKVNHLLAVAPLGVRPVLAAWGYNTNREHALAAAHGFAVAEIHTAAEILFRS